MTPTSKAALRGFLIDDDTQAAETAKLFSSDQLRLEFLEPGPLESFATQIFEAGPAIVLLDYRLDERAGTSGTPARYKASALAQQLRDLAGEDGDTDFPIVLHSAEANIKQLYRPEKTAHDLFDDVIKKDIRKESEQIIKRLNGLATGYASLVSLRPYDDNLLAVFGLANDSAELIDHQEIKHIAASTTIPHVFARFILNRLVGRNSILADEATVFARCGVDASDGDDRKSILEALAAAGVSYSGVFSDAYPTWWRLPLDEAINGWLNAPLTRLTARERAGQFSSHFGRTFKPATSTWSKSSDERFTHACAVCAKPTHIAHSVAVLEHTSGPLTERRRICFNCLQLDVHIKRRPDLVIDELDRPTEEAVRRGDIPRN